MEIAAIRDARLTGRTRNEPDRDPNPTLPLVGSEKGVLQGKVVEYSMAGGAKDGVSVESTEFYGNERERRRNSVERLRGEKQVEAMAQPRGIRFRARTLDLYFYLK